MDAVWITENRTAAVAAVAAMAMANTKAKIIKSNFEEIAKKCEVIASAAVILETPDPQFKDEWFFKKGQTIISSDCHTWYEDKTIKSADKYYQDSIAQHELLRNVGTYYPDGFPETIWETGEAFCGLKPGRENNDEFIVVTTLVSVLKTLS